VAKSIIHGNLNITGSAREEVPVYWRKICNELEKKFQTAEKVFLCYWFLRREEKQRLCQNIEGCIISKYQQVIALRVLQRHIYIYMILLGIRYPVKFLSQKNNMNY